MKYLAIMPGKKKPLAVSRSAADFYRTKAAKFFEVPDHLSAEKAREAIKFGMLEEAGIKLTWENGRPASGVAGAAAELQGLPFVPAPDMNQLKVAFDRRAPAAFWNKVRDLRVVRHGGAVVSMEALTKAVNAITESEYSVDELRAIINGEVVDGLPVHEKVVIGPVDLTAMHRTPLITFGTAAPHRWVGEPHYREVGFAYSPRVVVCVLAREGDYPSMIPLARQKALAYADVNGWSLGFVPTVDMPYRGTVFQDQEGKRRRGRKYEIGFPIISGLKHPRPESRFC